ncbi:hypothetical protein V5E97_31220 [Singulisphaera sp. Ch08]|uniref:Uncharacterized protein n=1 Tax=Singulisphaera sp. Ch08 TaxID=3120278 RepID=A0AAU7CC80_9BACT
MSSTFYRSLIADAHRLAFLEISGLALRRIRLFTAQAITPTESHFGLASAAYDHTEQRVASGEAINRCALQTPAAQPRNSVT